MTDQNEAAALEAAAKAICRESQKGRGGLACSPDCDCNNADEYGYLPEARAAVSAYKQALPAAPGVPERLGEQVRPIDEVPSLHGLVRDHFLGKAAPSAPLASTVAAPGVPEGWRPIDSAPTDGRHIRVAWLDGGVGFGIFDGKTVPMQTVAHWYGPADLPGLRAGGWYPSVQTNDSNEKLHPTHWKPLEDAPTPVAASGPTLGSEDGDDIAEWLAKQPQGANQALKDACAFYRANYRGEAPTSTGPSLVAADNWLPIETAPDDGTKILATGGGLGDEVDIVSYCPDVGCWEATNYTLDDRDDESEGYSRPLLWQPLPPPRLTPQGEAKTEDGK